MKKLLMLIMPIIISGCYNKIGRLTIVSTRNIDSKTDYVLLKKGVSGKAKTKNSNSLETAIDNAINDLPNG